MSLSESRGGEPAGDVAGDYAEADPDEELRGT